MGFKVKGGKAGAISMRAVGRFFIFPMDHFNNFLLRSVILVYCRATEKMPSSTHPQSIRRHAGVRNPVPFRGKAP